MWSAPFFKTLLHPLQTIAQCWEDLPLAGKGMIVIAVPLAVLLASLTSLYSREQITNLLETELSTALQNQRDIQTVHSQLLEASTGVRDYLLTGDKHFLQIFYAAETRLPIMLHHLERQLESDAQKARLAAIVPLVTENLNTLRSLSTHESDIASDDLIAQFKSQVKTLDALRNAIESLNAEEALLVAKDQADVALQRQHNLRLTLIAALAGIFGSIMAVWVFSRTIVKRVRLLRDSAGHLARAEALDLPSSSQDELGQLTDELEHASQLLAKNIRDAVQARREAEEASASKSMFLSRTSHELRTPLNAILGFAQLLEQDLPAGKQQDSVSLIKGAGQHLLKLINELLEIARIESGDISFEITPTAINPLLEEATHYLAPLGNARNIEIVNHHEENLWAYANRQKLLQVLLNLLSNALKYGPANAKVKLNAYAQGDQVIVEVIDQGAGIPYAHRERLFTPFDRLGAEHSKIEGTGLGMPLSRQLMLAMHGDIHVDEHKSLFWITLERAAKQTNPTVLNDKQGLKTSAPNNTKHEVVYVEDNVSNRALVEAIMHRQPNIRLHCVTTIRDAKQLLTQVDASLILIDLHLPDGSGETLVQHIQQSPILLHLPIIILSADAMPDTIARLRQAGVAHYVTKPLDVAVFTKTIKELLNP